MKKLLTTKEVAEILRVSEQHVRSLMNKGLIKAYKEGRKGGYRTYEDEVNRYIKEKFTANIVVPA